MRTPAPATRPVVLTVAGSDSGGGAGIQADVKAIEAAGGFATTAVTAITAQDTLGVEDVTVLDPSVVAGQIEAVVGDMDVAAVKTGMLATAGIIEVLGDALEATDAPVVIDPVMVAASGDRLLDRDAEAAYADLLGHATLVTPNAAEAEVLTGVAVEDEDDAVAAGEALRDMGAQAALVKGGHWGDERVVDVVVTEAAVESVTRTRIGHAATHGSGCTLASTVATHLAGGATVTAAVQDAVQAIDRAIRYYVDVGHGPGSVHHLATLRHERAARTTIETVRTLVDGLVAADVRPIIPEVGMNVVGVPPYAEVPDETVAVDGRLSAGSDGVRRGGDVRFGASGHVARYLLAVREHDPDIHVGANCRFDDAVETALETLEWTVMELDRREEPADRAGREGATMAWVAEQAYGGADPAPVAVYDRGAVGKEPMVRVVGETAATLRDRLLDLAVAVDED